jgi:hypothetical protein
MKADKIRRITSEILGHTGLTTEEKKEYFAAKYPKFSDKYPKLLAMCASPNPDTEMYLEYMLKMLEKTNPETNSRPISVHDASSHVGQKLYDDFVAPVLPPSTQQHGH